MSLHVGAVILRCGDSRNGAVEKALKKHFGWPNNCRVKTISVAGGAHSGEIDHDFLLKQVEIFAAVLKGKGAEKIYVIITDHNDCAYTKVFGEKDIKQHWTERGFATRIFGLLEEISEIHVMHVDYHNCDRAVVPSHEIRIIPLSDKKRD